MLDALHLNISSSSSLAREAPRPSIHRVSVGVLRMTVGTELVSYGERHTRLDTETWAAFMAVLEGPVRRHERMERLLNEPSIFD